MNRLAWLVLLVVVAPARAADEWVPAQTHAVIAGVLQWQNKGLTGWPTKHRKDEELHGVLLARGVPADQAALLLDEQATYSGIMRALTAACRRAGPDSTLLFYYCGHGGPCGAGDTVLMNYDVVPGQPKRTGLLVSDLAALIGREFHGRRVLFLADCCYSGGLAKAAKELADRGLQAASLTSAEATVTSTINWTFTQTAIDALAGDPLTDRDGDGTVTLDELAAEVRDAMRYLEHQPAGYATFGLPGSLKLGPAKRPAEPLDRAAGGYRARDYVRAPDNGKQREGRVIAVRDGKLVVQFYDYSEKRTVTVAPERVARATDGTTEKAEIEVEWQGEWWPATVLKREKDRTYIHYVGWGSEWDEWVTKDRIRPLRK